MHRRVGRGVVTGLLVLLAAAGLGGCGGGGDTLGATSGKTVFYPPPPDPPRYQFLTSFSTAAPWIPEQKTGFTDFVLGAERNTARPTGEISSPFDVASRDGKIYVCDLGAGKVHVIDAVAKSYATLGDSRTILHPLSITIAPDGTRYVVDGKLRRVAVFDANDTFLRHIGDPKTIAPNDLAVHGDELFVVDRQDGEIEVWDRQGKLLRKISSKGGRPEQFDEPFGIAVDSRGQVYVSDVFRRQVKVFDTRGAFLRMLGEAGDRPGYFGRPKGMAVDSRDRLYVADVDWDAIYVYSPEGQLLIYIHDRTEKAAHKMLHQTGLCIDGSSTIKAFEKFVAPGFRVEYLLLSANQLGENKVTVLAFGSMGEPSPMLPIPGTQPDGRRPGALTAGQANQP